MPSSTRIKGRALKLTLGTKEFSQDCISCILVPKEADKDVLTFADVAEGGGAAGASLKITGVQSTDAESLCMYLWDNSGKTVDFIFAPHGNATASATQPHFKGSITIGQRPDIGGEAGIGNTYTFEHEADLAGAVTKVTK